MAKQTNIWVYVIIALIVGFVIGYAASGGFGGAGKAIARTTTTKLGCPDGYSKLCTTDGACSCVPTTGGITTDVSCGSGGGRNCYSCGGKQYCCDGALGGNSVKCWTT